MKKKFLISFIVILLVLVFLVKPYYDLVAEITGVSPLKILLLPGNFTKFNDKVNIILLGKAGLKHDGPNLTDSIAVASLDLNTKKITLISIPRDIWSDTLQDKINAAYAYGEAKLPGGGIKLAKSEISAVVGFPISYGIVVDFNKFKNIVDFLGGIDVNVNKDFVDNKYPIDGRENDECNNDPELKCRYETIIFKSGLQHFNGNTALKYLRSRNSEGSEGTDFARTNRQQQVINAIATKILNIVKKMNLTKIRTLYSLIDKSVERDVKNADIAYIGKYYLRKTKINEIALSENLFIVPRKQNYYGKYVLIPKDSNYTQIHQFIDCMINFGTDKCKIK
ncbi:hypothetical protein A3C23_03095 [Candidatus Roizmanbacteria bacterium RIFCSPHIGHO2_02_FULL_37_13b]|uniref:Cell envelope-related transcriptional attenuator domain-containing protein n=1 Tax=Candidatus Roizmanbacteria bacterium RIFCSPLOWO2_02_FULL_36_11 TaxID=1802071 RepID=A0A1F7JIB4_9BACT|nr:MAG: hypothetical protein A3C23_03095 [Candidatus Roizmanbacteria bacterium RIFCSPHIGHO2_02_FULL_37_13b]OGK55337.1 MAG: hypothetical protein A3H78_04530 [Candidatus Roizmanbacteria bacterium RIFCSPLOWO2_02_FULL_36_11]